MTKEEMTYMLANFIARLNDNDYPSSVEDILRDMFESYVEHYRDK